MGRASIDGRPVVVLGDDFTVRGGSADATIPMKPILAERMANELRLPIIRIIEGSGGGGSVKTIETTGRANLPGQLGISQLHYQYLADNLGTVPVVALGLGSVAGLGAARLAASHYSVMTKSTSAMFVAGPPVVARASARTSSKQELGGWEVQCRAGAVDHAVDTEEEAFECARRFLSYLPPSVYSVPARAERSDPRRPARGDAVLASSRATGARSTRCAPSSTPSSTRASFFEMGQMFGRPMITGLARLDGLPVAILASDPYHYGGAWTADACAKIVRFVDLAETFHLPVVYLCDCPGFLIGLEAEKSATIRHGVRAMAAINQSSVPWCTVIVRNSFGVAGAAHVPAGRLAIRYAWLSALVGLAAAGGRHRGRLPRRDRRRTRPQGQARRDRGAAQRAALAVPHRRDVLGRGDHRPARHPQAAVRVRQPRRAAAHARAPFVLHAPLRQQDWRRQDQPPAALARARMRSARAT